MAGGVKLKDIANELGISVVTVSNGLSGKKGVSDAVRQRIIEKAKELGYDYQKPDKTENSEKKGITIGVIVSERYVSASASFYQMMYQQVVYMASRRQSLTMLEIIEEEKEQEEELPRLIQEGSVDGLIIIGQVKGEYIRAVMAVAQVPVVLMDFSCDQLNCDAVMSNNYLGMYKVTHYLLKKGHRDIGFIGLIENNGNLCDRYFGYRKGMAEQGIMINPDWVISNPEVIYGTIGIADLKTMPTAFVCCSDLVASFLYDELIQAGYRVPEDVSIVGYDNYLYGHPFARELTTYNVNMKAMAQEAVKILFKKISGDASYFGVRYLDSHIEERCSVKCVVT